VLAVRTILFGIFTGHSLRSFEALIRGAKIAEMVYFLLSAERAESKKKHFFIQLMTMSHDL